MFSSLHRPVLKTECSRTGLSPFLLPTLLSPGYFISSFFRVFLLLFFLLSAAVVAGKRHARDVSLTLEHTAALDRPPRSSRFSAFHCPLTLQSSFFFSSLLSFSASLALLDSPSPSLAFFRRARV
ncbi:putative transmembrane protein [Toxoplasma gondii MAS]|uniref:Putative transmembrane protein n=1 Tax=Toxoplasma gondii MAS TaxID=943118 RepID=A0A086PXA7_TOXGO|nr:putative transmembrane protein [Toxoplasma gondii MAS]